MSAKDYMDKAVVTFCDFDPAQQLVLLAAESDDERIRLKCIEVMMDVIQETAKAAQTSGSDFEDIITRSYQNLDKDGYYKLTVEQEG